MDAAPSRERGLHFQRAFELRVPARELTQRPEFSSQLLVPSGVARAIQDLEPGLRARGKEVLS